MTNTQSSPPGSGRVIDPRAFRDTLGHYASGLTVITGADSGGPIGFTCQSFYSVSVDPPLVSFSVKNDSTTYPRIRDTGSFAVNVMSCKQEKIATQFAVRGSDKWTGIQWNRSASGNPIITDTLMWLDCAISAEYEAGDHRIVIGQVRDMSPPEWHREEPLLYFRGAFRRLSNRE